MADSTHTDTLEPPVSICPPHLELALPQIDLPNPDGRTLAALRGRHSARHARSSASARAITGAGRVETRAARRPCRHRHSGTVDPTRGGRHAPIRIVSRAGGPSPRGRCRTPEATPPPPPAAPSPPRPARRHQPSSVRTRQGRRKRATGERLGGYAASRFRGGSGVRKGDGEGGAPGRPAGGLPAAPGRPVPRPGDSRYSIWLKI